MVFSLEDRYLINMEDQGGNAGRLRNSREEDIKLIYLQSKCKTIWELEAKLKKKKQKIYEMFSIFNEESKDRYEECISMIEKNDKLMQELATQLREQRAYINSMAEHCPHITNNFVRRED